MKPHISVLALIGLLGCLACSVSSQPDEPPEPTLPPLEANFPYEKLGSGKIVFNRLGPDGNNYSSVYVADIDSRRSWAIEIGNAVGPAVSPDGSKIAFSKFAEGHFDIHVMNIDGSGLQNVTNLVGQDWYPSWTPDSKQVLFYLNESREIYRQSPIANPSDREVIRSFFNYGWQESPAAVSPSLQLAFAYVTSGVPENIYAMNWEGTSLVRLTWLAFGHLWSPCWSPDGTLIAFMSGAYIYVMDADGSNLQSVASVITNQDTSTWIVNTIPQWFSLCWSPDGTKILFNKLDGNHCLHLFVMNADGTDISQVTFANSVIDRSVSWSKF